MHRNLRPKSLPYHFICRIHLPNIGNFLYPIGMQIPRIINVVAAVVILGGVAGCTHLGNPGLDDVNNFMILKKGVDTKETIYAKFGQPANVVYSNVNTGPSAWTFVKSDSHPNAWSFVPYVGIVAGGQNQDTTKAFFSFDASGRFLEVHTSKDSTYVNNLGEIGTAIAGRSRNQVQRVHDEMDRMGKPFDRKLAVNVGEVR